MIQYKIVRYLAVILEQTVNTYCHWLPVISCQQAEAKQAKKIAYKLLPKGSNTQCMFSSAFVLLKYVQKRLCFFIVIELSILIFAFYKNPKHTFSAYNYNYNTITNKKAKYVKEFTCKLKISSSCY